MSFDIISIAYIVIIVLFTIFGIKRGLFKSLVSLIKNGLTFILSIILAKPLALIFSRSQFGLKISRKFTELFTEKGGVFAINIHEGNTSEVIDFALDELSLPDSLSELLDSLLRKHVVFDPTVDMTLAQAFGPVITHYIFLAISFILVFIIIRIACSLLNKLFTSLEQIPIIKVVNKSIGGILGAFTGFLLVCLISFALTFIIPIDFSISEWLIKVMKLGEPDVMTFSKYLYQENILLKIISYLQNLIVRWI